MLNLLLFALTAADNGNGPEAHHEYSHDEFMELSLADLEELTGVIRPKSSTTETLAEYRETAWASYRQDIANRDEWGNARQGDVEPAGPGEPVDEENPPSEQFLPDDDEGYASDELLED